MYLFKHILRTLQNLKNIVRHNNKMLQIQDIKVLLFLLYLVNYTFDFVKYSVLFTKHL